MAKMIITLRVFIARRFLVLEAWMVLHAMSILLKVWGFGKTVKHVCPQQDGRKPVPTAPDEAAVDRVTAAIARAKGWHMRGTTEDCLPVALTGLVLLRRKGVAAQLMLGVRRFPFGAHAWVKVGERVVDFPPEKHRNFVAVAVTDGMRWG